MKRRKGEMERKGTNRGRMRGKKIGTDWSGRKGKGRISEGEREVN